MKTYIVADIHGEYEKLIDCLKQVNFDYENDTLIQLGDIVDRGENSYLCIEELLKINRLISIKGNHDDEWLNYLERKGTALWEFGARQTLMSYEVENINPEVHYNFFKNQLLYYIDEENNLFVHGGFNRHYDITDEIHNSKQTLIWDRDLLSSAMNYQRMTNKEYPFKIKGNFKNIFIGHTPSPHFIDEPIPMFIENIILLDTGCGKGDYPLTIMDLETKQYWQSKC